MSAVRINELKDRAERILRSQSYWKSSQDGSYEMALDNAGYYRILDEIRELEKDMANDSTSTDD